MRATNEAPAVAGTGDPGLRLVDHSRIARKELDVAYAGVSPAQRLDVYLPARGTGPFPLILFIHGGAFMMCDKADGQVQPYLRAVERGYVVASVNYRLSGEAPFPAAVHDVRAALRFLRANAARFHLDPDRVAACGGSAGGNLGALLCTLSGRTELDDLSLGHPGQSSAVQAGVIWYPPTDFLSMDEQLRRNRLGPADHGEPDSPESRYLGGQITHIDPALVRAANPATYVHRDTPPMLIQHGRLDHLVPWQQSSLLVERIEQVCGPENVKYEVFENADHADPLFETGSNMERVFGFLDDALWRTVRPAPAVGQPVLNARRTGPASHGGNADQSEMRA